jgi:hypothetical protein
MAHDARKNTIQMQRAAAHGASFVATKGHDVDSLQAEAEAYVAARNAIDIDGEPTCKLLPFGLDDPKFKELLLEAITAATVAPLLHDGVPLGPYAQTFGPRTVNPETAAISLSAFAGEVWLVSGSTTLLNVLYEVMPLAYFCVVQVGRTIWPDQIQKDRTRIYVAPERFYDKAVVPAPYPTVDTYDEKLYRFWIKDGGSIRPHVVPLIWNVGSNREV